MSSRGPVDIFLQEDGNGEQFVRGVTRRGEIYDFARTTANETEFCGGCFDPDGNTLYMNQQGDRGSLPDGPANATQSLCDLRSVLSSILTITHGRRTVITILAAAV